MIILRNVKLRKQHLPFSLHSTEEELDRFFESVNGLLFPGGGEDLKFNSTRRWVLLLSALIIVHHLLDLSCVMISHPSTAMPLPLSFSRLPTILREWKSQMLQFFYSYTLFWINTVRLADPSRLRNAFTESERYVFHKAMKVGGGGLWTLQNDRWGVASISPGFLLCRNCSFLGPLSFTFRAFQDMLMSCCYIKCNIELLTLAFVLILPFF